MNMSHAKKLKSSSKTERNPEKKETYWMPPVKTKIYGKKRLAIPK